MNSIKKKPNVTIIRSNISEILSIWNSSVGILTELFWNEVKKENLEIERKDPLLNALIKGKLHHSIDMFSRYNWEGLKNSKLLDKRFDSIQIEIIEKMIYDVEKKYVEFLKKCLIKPILVYSNYFKYGNAIGYLTKGELFDSDESALLCKHFTKDEIIKLDEIWKV